MSPPIARIILYVKDIQKVSSFYQKHFGWMPLPGEKADWLELAGPDRNCTLALHQAAKSQKTGAAMKIVFSVADVDKFVAEQALAGLKFGAVRRADGFDFANAKDPAGNAISISSRGIK